MFQPSSACAPSSQPCTCRYTHMIGDGQWEYLDWLLQQADPAAPPMPGYRQALLTMLFGQ